MAQRRSQADAERLRLHARRSRDQRLPSATRSPRRRCWFRPTKFHNSVHNAAAGYWTIATGCLKPYTSVSGYYFTYGEGLLEAASQALEREHAGAATLPSISKRAARSARCSPAGASSPVRWSLRRNPAGASLPSCTFEAFRRTAARRCEGWAFRAGRERRARRGQCHGERLAAVRGAGGRCRTRSIVQPLAPQLGLHLRVSPASAAHETSPLIEGVMNDSVVSVSARRCRDHGRRARRAHARPAAPSAIRAARHRRAGAAASSGAGSRAQGRRVVGRDRCSLLRHRARSEGAPQPASAQEVRLPVLLLGRA